MRTRDHCRKRKKYNDITINSRYLLLKRWSHQHLWSASLGQTTQRQPGVDERLRPSGLSSSLLFLKLSLALRDLMLLPWPYMLMHGIHMYLEPLYSSEIDGCSSGIIGGSILTRSLTWRQKWRSQSLFFSCWKGYVISLYLFNIL